MTPRAEDKILIVDDESDIAWTLKQYLDGMGYVTALATDGATALDMLLSKNDYTVALLDISMPGLDGVTVLKRLKETGSDIAVIMMSGHGSEKLAVECMRNGAEDYISKPFSLEDIQQRIERAHSHRLERLEKRQLQREKEDFILMLSHDLKNPLTAVIGSVDIIRAGCLGPVNEEQVEYLQSAIDSCNEVVNMIDNLLDIKKLEAGKMQMTLQPYNTYELVAKITDQFARPAKHDGIELSVDITPGASSIAVDKHAFNRVLGNLLGNAIKFTPEGGRITVSTSCFPDKELKSIKIPSYAQIPSSFKDNDCFVKLSVHDSGEGILPDELERIFDRYTQFNRKTGREQGGAGLGLAYCRLAVEGFQGMIWAESQSGKGSEFVILLPCHSAACGDKNK